MRKSQKELIRQHLIDKRSITPRQALDLYGCMRLAARIGELRDEYGQMAVVTDERRHICKATGNAGQHALYICNVNHLEDRP